MRPGYETGNNPFYMKFPREQYYKDHQCDIKYLYLIFYNYALSKTKLYF